MPENAKIYAINKNMNLLPPVGTGWKQKAIEDALPKTSNLSSVFMFAECIPSGTRQTSSLPSAELKTLGKEGVCRVFSFLHSAKK